jgi:hypothetical protein
VLHHWTISQLWSSDLNALSPLLPVNHTSHPHWTASFWRLSAQCMPNTEELNGYLL